MILVVNCKHFNIINGLIPTNSKEETKRHTSNIYLYQMRNISVYSRQD